MKQKLLRSRNATITISYAKAANALCAQLKEQGWIEAQHDALSLHRSIHASLKRHFAAVDPDEIFVNEGNTLPRLEYRFSDRCKRASHEIVRQMRDVSFEKRQSEGLSYSDFYHEIYFFCLLSVVRHARYMGVGIAKEHTHVD